MAPSALLALHPLDLSVFPLMMGQHTVSGSPVGSAATIATMLEFAARHDIKPVIETDQTIDALARFRTGQARWRR